MMKQLFFILLLVFPFAFIACEDNETLIDANKNILEAEGKSAVIRAGDLSNIRFKDLPGSISLDEAIPKGEIRVEASEDVGGLLKVEERGGELRIEGKENLPANLDLNFYMNPLDIRRIVVEGDNKVLITATPVLDYLELKTEGSSELVIHNLKVRNLVSRREGKSRMFLSSKLVDFNRTTFPFLASTVQVLDDHNIIYRDNDYDYMLYAPQITLRNDSVFAIGSTANPLRSYFITQTHELRNEGESLLDALDLPTLAVTSKNEGRSISKVWALNQLTVKGEGESVMFYMGEPELDYKLEGSAKLIEL